MSTRLVVRRAAILAAVCAYALGAHPAASTQDPRPAPQAQPSFRTGVTAVPIEVRVVGKDGKPVAGLTRDDFTILEDGVPQAVSHFAPVTLTAEPPRTGLRASPDTAAFTTTPQDYRVFLIVLGQRAFGDPTRHPETLNAVIDFVRHKLLPQDQVALLAGTRTVDFTPDHEKVARQLETFRTPPGAGRSAPAALPKDAPTDSPSTFASPVSLDPPPDIEDELGLADYLKARRGQPLDELESLFYGISYLRFMEGEKHLIFVTERGPQPTWDEVKALTIAASNARVALNTIQTDVRIGETMITHPMVEKQGSGEDRSHDPTYVAYNPNAPQLRPPPKPREGPGEPMREQSPLAPGTSAPVGGSTSSAASLGFGGIYDLKYIAAQTGGLSSVWDDAALTLGRVDDATRANYLLAYYPSNADWDGRFRSVVVKVNRPDVRVLYRHGYSALREVEAFDRRRVVTNTRIEAAGSQMTDIPDLAVTFTPAFAKAATGRGGEVTVALQVGAERLAWGIDESGRHAASLDVAIYCSDDNQKVIGQTRRALNLALTDETYARMLKEGIARTLHFTVTGRPRYVKTIVYDYRADRLGSRMIKLK